jgi:hypothetical protein
MAGRAHALPSSARRDARQRPLARARELALESPKAKNARLVGRIRRPGVVMMGLVHIRLCQHRPITNGQTGKPLDRDQRQPLLDQVEFRPMASTGGRG